MPARRSRILIADGDAALVRALQSLLAKDNYDPQTVLTYKDLLRTAFQFRPQLDPAGFNLLNFLIRKYKLFRL